MWSSYNFFNSATSKRRFFRLLGGQVFLLVLIQQKEQVNVVAVLGGTDAYTKPFPRAGFAVRALRIPPSPSATSPFSGFLSKSSWICRNTSSAAAPARRWS